jgi:hypothetical protein
MVMPASCRMHAKKYECYEETLKTLVRNESLLSVCSGPLYVFFHVHIAAERSNASSFSAILLTLEKQNACTPCFKSCTDKTSMHASSSKTVDLNIDPLLQHSTHSGESRLENERIFHRRNLKAIYLAYWHFPCPPSQERSRGGDHTVPLSACGSRPCRPFNKNATAEVILFLTTLLLRVQYSKCAARQVGLMPLSSVFSPPIIRAYITLGFFFFFPDLVFFF